MSMSEYLKDLVLDKVLKGVDFTTDPVFVSLHTGDPGTTGANEVTGGSYVRISIGTNWDAAALGVSKNTDAILFEDLPACTVKFLGLWDDESAGNWLWGGPLQADVVVAGGQSFQFNSETVSISLVECE